MEKSKKYASVDFTKRLKALWLRSGMTQEEMSHQIGWERKTIHAWLQGYSIPNAIAVAHLCRLFNVSADYLLFGEEEENAVHTP